MKKIHNGYIFIRFLRFFLFTIFLANLVYCKARKDHATEKAAPGEESRSKAQATLKEAYRFIYDIYVNPDNPYLLEISEEEFSVRFLDRLNSVGWADLLDDDTLRRRFAPLSDYHPELAAFVLDRVIQLKSESDRIYWSIPSIPNSRLVPIDNYDPHLEFLNFLKQKLNEAPMSHEEAEIKAKNELRATIYPDLDARLRDPMKRKEMELAIHKKVSQILLLEVSKRRKLQSNKIESYFIEWKNLELAKFQESLISAIGFFAQKRLKQVNLEFFSLEPTANMPQQIIEKIMLDEGLNPPNLGKIPASHIEGVLKKIILEIQNLPTNELQEGDPPGIALTHEKKPNFDVMTNRFFVVTKGLGKAVLFRAYDGPLAFTAGSNDQDIQILINYLDILRCVYILLAEKNSVEFLGKGKINFDALKFHEQTRVWITQPSSNQVTRQDFYNIQRLISEMPTQIQNGKMNDKIFPSIFIGKNSFVERQKDARSRGRPTYSIKDYSKLANRLDMALLQILASQAKSDSSPPDALSTQMRPVEIPGETSNDLRQNPIRLDFESAGNFANQKDPGSEHVQVLSLWYRKIFHQALSYIMPEQMFIEMGAPRATLENLIPIKDFLREPKPIIYVYYAWTPSERTLMPIGHLTEGRVNSLVVKQNGKVLNFGQDYVLLFDPLMLQYFIQFKKFPYQTDSVTVQVGTSKGSELIVSEKALALISDVSIDRIKELARQFGLIGATQVQTQLLSLIEVSDGQPIDVLQIFGTIRNAGQYFVEEFEKADVSIPWDARLISYKDYVRKDGKIICQCSIANDMGPDIITILFPNGEIIGKPVTGFLTHRKATPEDFHASLALLERTDAGNRRFFTTDLTPAGINERLSLAGLASKIASFKEKSVQKSLSERQPTTQNEEATKPSTQNNELNRDGALSPEKKAAEIIVGELRALSDRMDVVNRDSNLRQLFPTDTNHPYRLSIALMAVYRNLLRGNNNILAETLSLLDIDHAFTVNDSFEQKLSVLSRAAKRIEDLVQKRMQKRQPNAPYGPQAEANVTDSYLLGQATSNVQWIKDSVKKISIIDLQVAALVSANLERYAKPCDLLLK